MYDNYQSNLLKYKVVVELYCIHHVWVGYPEHVKIFLLKKYINPIHYCYENKEIAGKRHSKECHLSATNLTLICEIFETFAPTINKHLGFNINLSKIKSGFNMSFGAKAEQRTYIIVCVELGKSPMKTKQLQEKTQSVSSVSRALVYRWHQRFSEDSSAH